MMSGWDQTEDALAPAYSTVQAFYPWRRYLARMLDLSVYKLLWVTFLELVCRVNFANQTGLEKLFSSFIIVAAMLFAEPLLLRLFGTTLGKAVFGLRITAPDGKHLTYHAGLERTWGVIGAGMGYNIPIYNLIRLWKSYQLCKERQPQPWDEAVCYTIKDTKRYRVVVYVGAWVALFGLLVMMISVKRLPPNRGDLTVAQFSENYHYYASFLEINLGEDYLDENGKWTKNPFDGRVYLDAYANPPPAFVYTVENGVVTGVSFIAEIENNKEWLTSYDSSIMLASLALAGAQKEVGLFSNAPQRILQQIEQSTFQDFAFTEAGISFVGDTEYSGYTPSTEIGLLLPEDNAQAYYYKVSFSMQKEK